MDLKGTRTEKNLLAAFSGESMARNKYLFFADKAKQEGEEEVAQLFEMMARNEGVHGKLLYQSMKQIGTSSENLQEAMEGEYGEWSSMYPAFAQVAREEGFSHIGTLFDEIAKIEKDHEFRFLGALAKLKEAHKNADVAAIDTAIAELNAAWQAASQDIYAQQQAQGAQPGADAGQSQSQANAGGASNGGDSSQPEDVEFEEVK